MIRVLNVEFYFATTLLGLPTGNENVLVLDRYLMKNAIKETTGLVEGVIKTEKGSPRDVNAFEAETTNPLDEDDGIMADKGDSL